MRVSASVATARASAAGCTGLLKCIWNPAASARLALVFARVCGHCRRGDRRELKRGQGPDRPNELAAVFARHRDIREEQIDFVTLERLERVACRRRRYDRSAARLEGGRHHFPRIGLIVDDENGQPLQRRHRLVWLGRRCCRRRRCPAIRSRLDGGQGDDERRAAVWAFAFGLEPASLRLDELPRDEQAQPRPPTVRVVALSACRNRSNTWGRNAGSIPAPVSMTRTSALWPESLASTSMRPPDGVNFTALVSRLRKICSRRRGIGGHGDAEIAAGSRARRPSPRRGASSPRRRP